MPALWSACLVVCCIVWSIQPHLSACLVVCLPCGLLYSMVYPAPLFLLLRPFPHLESAHQVFNLHVLRSCASSIFTCFLFMSFLITSLHLSFGLPTFQCPPTSIFHILLTISSSVFRNLGKICTCSFLVKVL